ncbi:S-adenosyl-L-methionine-dependent methyltransferase [Trichoderma chlorosporum]
MSASNLSIDEVLKSLNSINSENFTADGDRSKALLAAYALVSRLETPWESVARLCMNQPALIASWKTAKDLQLFEKWHERGDGPESSDALAELVGCDKQLFSRILRHLSVNHVIEEVSASVYKPTTFSLALLQPVFGEWINYLYDAAIPCFLRMPEYLQKTNYQTPVDPDDGVFQYAKDFKGDLFKYYAENPREGASFNHVMGGVMANQASWVNIIPAETFINGSDPAQPLVVDVGGNVGHDIEKFRKVFPETASRLYLEDRPGVIALSTVPEPVNKLAHDFFQPQPIKGSRVYYMHGVLHDWADEPARKILENLRDALKPGYSKLLIHDHIVPETSAHPHATSYDLTMMVLVAGLERTESAWHALLKSAGYKVIKVWRSPLAAQAILEAELA